MNGYWVLFKRGFALGFGLVLGAFAAVLLALCIMLAAFKMGVG